MKRFFYILAISLWIGFPFVYANTQTPAANISVTTSTFSNCLSSLTTNAQLAFNTLDTCLGNIVSSQWTTSGSNIYNNNVGNVGIGISNPSQKLDVNGIVRSNSGGIEFPDNTIQTTAASPSSPGGSQGQFQYNNSGNFAGGTMLATDGTNVGVGSASPGTKLDVSGIVRSTTGGFTFPDGSNQISAATSTPPAGTGTELQYRNGTSFGAVSGSGVTVAGNVGIGTSVPTQKLDVTGTIRATGAINSTDTTNGIQSNGSTAIVTKGSGSWAIATPGTNVGGSQNIIIGSGLAGGSLTGGQNSTLGSDAGRLLQGAATRNSFFGATSGQGITTGTLNTAIGYLAQFGANVTNSTAIGANATVNSSNAMVLGDGGVNVGISSSSPSQRLDVTGTIRASSNILVGSNSVCQSDGTNCPVVSSQWTTINTNDVYLPNNGNVGIGTTKTTTASLTVMNGNVGIGTWVPVGILDVHLDPNLIYTNQKSEIGNGIVLANYSSSYAGLWLGTPGSLLSPSTTNYSMIGNGSGLIINTPATNSPLFIRQGNSDRVNISSTGNVGVGNTTPSAKLSVTAVTSTYTDPNSGVGGFILSDGTGATTDNILAMGTNTDGRYSYIQAIKAGTGGNNLLLQPNNGSGNVGIGTANPRTLLEIGNGGINFTSAGNMGIGLISPTSKFQILSSSLYTDPQNAGTAGMILSDGTGVVTDNILGMGTNATGRYSYIQAVKPGTGFNSLYLNPSGGNVGVGTFIPIAQLGVYGVGTASVLNLNSSLVAGNGVTLSLTAGPGLVLNTGSAFTSANNGGFNLVNSVSTPILPVYSFRGDTTTGMGTPSNGSNMITWDINGVEKMRMDTNGNIGIGTNAPTKLLQVVASSGNGIRIGGSTGIASDLNRNPGGGLDLLMSGDVVDTSNLFSVGDSTGQKVSVLASGNVGIGTTTPQGGLVVTNGNVGVGTFSPIGALEVEGGNVGMGTTASTGGSSERLYLKTNGNGSGTYGFTIKNSSNAAVFQVRDDGYVLAGTTTLSTVGIQYVINASGYKSKNGGIFGWVSSTTDAANNALDTGFSRLAAGKVGIGTGMPGDFSGVLSAANIGIGTFDVSGGGLIVKTGNVGIGSNAPGALLDIGSTGTIRVNKCAAHAGQTSCIGTGGVAGYCTGLVGAGGACSCTDC